MKIALSHKRGITQNKMRILYIVEAMGGGVFTYIVDLANELAKHNEIFIAYATRPQTPENYRDYFDPAIELIKVNSFTREVNPAKDLKAIIEVKKIAERVQPEIIHLHSSKAGVIGRIAFNGERFPLYYTPHGYSFLMENYKPVKRAVFKAIESSFARRNCTTISCSYGEHQETLKLTDRARYVNNGINMSEMRRVLETVETKEHPFTVFTLGRICYQKNPALFNAIAEALPDVSFLWVGDGELREQLKAKNITITGWIDRAEALRRSMNADVFLLTSLWEGLPISLLEAMYMKKLCVVSDVIGNHDVIQNGINGFVCRTVADYKKAILTEKTEEIIQSAYEDIQKEYNTVIMAEKYAEIYDCGTKRKIP